MGSPRLAELAATRAPGHEPHDDEDGHRDQPDDDKRLERSHDPGRSRDDKPNGKDRAEDCPDDPAHVPSMPPDPGAGEPGAIIALHYLSVGQHWCCSSGGCGDPGAASHGVASSILRLPLLRE